MNKLIACVCIITLVTLFVISGCTPGTDSAAPSVARTETPTESPLDCNWVLKVDQTIPVTTDGLTVNYTLVLIAQKAGGTDVYGAYEGAAYIASELDASNLSNAFLDVTGGFHIEAFANNLSFEIVPYDKEKYSRYGIGKDEAPDVPLVEYESMALISPEMTGSGVLNPDVSGENVNAGYHDSGSGTALVALKIAVKSGKVEATVPMFNTDSFEGILVGEPDDEQYQKGMARVDALIQNSQSAQEPSGNDSMGGLAGQMGTIGSNLPLPESFPADELPLAPDANIQNVFESEDKKNVRVIYATAMDYGDILTFYAPVIERMEQQLDIDTGMMYIGSSEKYSRISLMVLETKTKADSNMVTLEVLRK